MLRRHRWQRGLSLVELMVGIAVGLFVVAAASMLVVTQLGDNRRLLLETQLQQDLRAAADIMTRELRRAGHTPAALRGVWQEQDVPVERNLVARVTVTGASPSSEVEFRYNRDGQTGIYGYKLVDHVIKSRLSTAGWQDLTDASTLKVTELAITEHNTEGERLPCPRACPAPNPVGETDDYCWPTQTVRELLVEITGEATSDANVRRTVRSSVRLRNDLLNFNPPGSTQICPG
jgi:type IV pilus assembly protein PilW